MLVLQSTANPYTYSGTTTVESGRLSVNGTVNPLAMEMSSSITGKFVVQAGATLGGTGTVHRPVEIQAGGTLSPGNSIGTLTVDSLTFSPTATLQVEINSLGQASRVSVTGEATLGGTVSVLAQPGTYSTSGSYPILEAGSLTGQFSGVTGPKRFTFSLSYPSNSVLLNYFFQQPIATTGLSGNPLAWATYLNTNGSNAQLALIENSGNSRHALSRSLLRNTPQRVALDHLEPLLVLAFSGESSECRATVRTGQREECITQELVTPHGSLLRQHREKVCGAIRAEGFGGLFSQKGNSVAPGYDAAQGGAIVACDAFDSWGSAGLLVSYARTHFKVQEHFGKGNFDTAVAAPYATFYWGKGYTEIGVLAGALHTHQKRKIQFPGVDEVAKSSYWSAAVDPHLSLGYDFDVGNCCFIEPYLSLDWLVLWNPAYSEQGSSFAMHVEKNHSSLLRSEAGLNFYQTWCGDCWSHSLRETVSYLNRKYFSLHELTASLPGITPTVTFHYPNKDQNLAAWGLEYFFRHCSSGFFGSLRYDGEAGAKSMRNFLRLELGAYF